MGNRWSVGRQIGKEGGESEMIKLVIVIMVVIMVMTIIMVMMMR